MEKGKDEIDGKLRTTEKEMSFYIGFKKHSYLSFNIILTF